MSTGKIYDPAFRSHNRLSKALWQESCSFQRVKSPTLMLIRARGFDKYAADTGGRTTKGGTFMKKSVVLPGIATLLVTACLAACSSRPPTPVTFGDVCQKAGDRVAIEGYLRLPVMGTNCKSGRCMLNLISALQGQVQSIPAQVRDTAKPDSGVNAIEPLPEKFSDRDLRIHADDGKVVAPNTKLRMTGEVQKAGGGCELSVDVIEVAGPAK